MFRMPFSVWLPTFFIFLAGAMALPDPGRAEIRALLVGVSDYDNSVGLSDLKGPANDGRLMQQVLRGRGVEDISIVADGVAGGVVPTRANILQAMADMAAESAEGDLVYIHLSGHGTQQPDPEGDETDGLDEVFLPADTAPALPGTNAITNALVDDDIGRAVRAIRETGANVWLVMDSCNSGSGLRAAPGRAVARLVDPRLLGIDITPSQLGERQLIETQGPEPKGGFLAFYSARSSEVANEVAFAGKSGEEWYGLFTAKLAIRLAASADLSYRQLFQGVLADMNDTSLPGGARMQTPGWSGTLIDAPVLGLRATPGMRRFALRDDEVMAGLLHGLRVGTVLGLVADAADPPDAIIGYAQVEDASATSAYLRPVAADCPPRALSLCPYAGSLPPQARYAQIVARPVNAALRLAPPRARDSGQVLPSETAAMVALQQAIDQINKTDQWNITLESVGYDVESLWDGQKLWFGPRTLVGQTPVGLSASPDVDALVPALTRIARAEGLARLLDSVTRESDFLSPNPVAVTATLTRSDIDDLTPVGSDVAPRQECNIAKARVKGRGGELPASADLKQCDLLAFSAMGTQSGARDVNRIQISADYCVYADYQLVEDANAPRLFEPVITVCSDCPGGYSAGYERMYFVVTEARRNSEPLNMTGLVETCDATEPVTRGAASARMRSFLDRLGGQAAKRRGLGDADVWGSRFDWRVMPKPEAFAQAGRKAGQ